MLLNNRQVSVTLRQNTGITSQAATELDLSPFLLTLGAISWDVDENLTKLSCGNLSLTCTDDTTNTVWNFITSGLISSMGLLPPWIMLSLDGVTKFIGIVKDTPTRTQDAGTLEIQINAVDWSSMLESKRIEATDASIIQRRSKFKDNPTGAAAQGLTISCDSVLNSELLQGHDSQTVFIAASENANFKAGDWVYFYNYSLFTSFNKRYPVISKQVVSVSGLGSRLCLSLGGGFHWLKTAPDPLNGRQTSSLFKVYMSTQTIADGVLPSFTAAEDFTSGVTGATPKMDIKLNMIDGLEPGDVLNKVTNFLSTNDSAFSVTITDIDPTSNMIYLSSPLKNNLVSGTTTFTIDSKSLEESVLTPIMSMVDSSLAGVGSADYSSYHPVVLPTPCFSFISGDSPGSQNTNTEQLAGVFEVQASSTGYEVLGIGGKAWSGLPGSGWATLGSYTSTVDWTAQSLTPPTYRMPFHSLPVEAPVKSVKIKAHNRYAGMQGFDDNDFMDPNEGNVFKFIYDYSNLRYYEFKFLPALTLTVQNWNGSVWTTVVGFSTVGIGSPIQVIPFKDTISSVGSGYGLLALYADGTVKTILSTVSLTADLVAQGCPDALSQNQYLQVHMVQTTNGVYYLTPSGYGKIQIVGGVLKTPWTPIVDSGSSKNKLLTITPMDNTFIYANNRIITLAKASYKEKASDQQTIDDTYLLQLQPDILNLTNPSDALLEDPAFIVKNIPRATMAVKSPISQDIFGLMGGRLFQINNYLPDTVERFSSLHQTAQALVEFVCSMTNSVAMSTVDGKLKLYTRGYKNTAVNVVVDQVSLSEATWNKHMADCVVIKGAGGARGVAKSTTQLAGLTISYQNDTFIRNSSQANSLAQSYLAFFEKPRKEVTQEWFCQTTPTPWETLSPMDVITINGSVTQYFLTGLSWDLDTSVATVKLLEAL